MVATHSLIPLLCNLISLTYKMLSSKLKWLKFDDISKSNFRIFNVDNVEYSVPLKLRDTETKLYWFIR